MSVLNKIKALSLGVSLVLGAGHASAAVFAPTTYTDDGAGTFTSLTINGTVYNDLTGCTAALTTPDTYFYTGTPTLSGAAQANTAASGLDWRTGAGNVDIGSLFQFGRTITSQDRIFVTDLHGGTATEGVGFQLVNSSNTVLGTYSISIASTSFGSLITSNNYTVKNNSDGSGNTAQAFVQNAVSFQLSDFTGTGDLSTATGIRLSGGTANSWDPSVVGLAAVPEPSSLFLLGLGTVTVLSRRRRTAK
jgi:hypothetical protein